MNRRRQRKFLSDAKSLGKSSDGIRDRPAPSETSQNQATLDRAFFDRCSTLLSGDAYLCVGTPKQCE